MSLPPAVNGWTPEQTAAYYQRKNADRLSKIRPERPESRHAVSKERAEELKSAWRESTKRWYDGLTPLAQANYREWRKHWEYLRVGYPANADVIAQLGSPLTP